MGMDPGDKTIGLSLSDSGQGIATPLQTINRTKFSKDIEIIRSLVKEYEIGGFVMGWPLNMDGSEGPRCDMVRSLADEMAKKLKQDGPEPWIALWDERLSTQAVEDFLVDTVDMSRTKRKRVVDKLAAQMILQNALDFAAQA